MDNQFTIFFAWHSVESKLNRNVIEWAIEKAIGELKLPHALANLDRDTKGVSGTPDIVDTILEKIRQSDAFVADVSLVGTDSREERLPNPNVLFELGYAVRHLGWERVILVVNESLGEWEDAPFDLGGTRRWPLRYRLAQSDNRNVARDRLKDGFKEAFRAIYKANKSSSLLHCGPARLDITRFLAMSRSGNNPFMVSTFQATLENRSDSPIGKISGFVELPQSQMRIRMMLNKDGELVDHSVLAELPPLARLVIVARFPASNSAGISEDEFIDKYTPFLVCLEIEETRATFSFGASDVERLLRLERATLHLNDASPLWK